MVVRKSQTGKVLAAVLTAQQKGFQFYWLHWKQDTIKWCKNNTDG
jgi:hypothetical protein